ncbi:snoRNA-binding protein [Coelomomyces lativittatus]|nr:snoRNA-binding protein [Coelomomyces lativittatus]
MDIISHFPVLCEDYQVPYVFVNSKYNLSAALAIKRPVSALLISSKCQASLKETYDSCFKAIKAIQTQV